MRRLPLIASIIVWLSLAIRLSIDIIASVTVGSGPIFGILKFISAFTTLTNILVAAVLTAAATKSESRALRFLSKPSAMGCTATYITVMACVWKVTLAPSFAVGFQMLAESINIEKIVGVFLHGVNPALFFAYWLFFAPKRKLQWKHAFIWPVGGLVYFVLILIRGAVNGIYPYPFINVNVLGYPRVMLNAIVVLAVFVAFGLTLVAIDRWDPLGRGNTRFSQK